MTKIKEQIKEEKNKAKRRWPFVLVIIGVILALFVLAGLFWERSYYNLIYPGVQAGGKDLSGLSLEQAQQYIQESADKLKNGLVFNCAEKNLTVKSNVSSFDIDLSYPLFSIDARKTAENAYAIGRNFNFLINWKDKITSLLFGKKIFLVSEIDRAKLLTILQDGFRELISPAQDAQLFQDKYGTFSVLPEKAGQEIDYDSVIKDFSQHLEIADTSPIEVKILFSKPKIYRQYALNVDNQAKNLLALAPLSLSYKEKNWKIDEDVLAEWLELQLNNNGEQKVVVGFSKEKIEKYLSEKIAVEVDKEPSEARFKMSGGRVSVFQKGQDGWKTDLVNTAENIVKALVEKNAKVELTVQEEKTTITDPEQAGDLGLKEIIGTGHSSFNGSPANRRHNIKVGAQALNGILIKPGETFSLVTVLGEIDAVSGYLPELVIKENKTVPEYGGGLCQIGTTIFRTALNAGLPIIERRNHSYRVSYYEPAGTDATIYSPKPDFKFLNDTENYILIQYRLGENDLYFDLWGTKDGRQVEQSKPVIYNITEPAETKIIETTDLKVGEKKCTEHAHNGADAYFDYKVSYANGEVKEKRFSSHYVPWQEVCLLGVEKLSEENEEQTAPMSDETKEGVGVYEPPKEN